MTRAPSAQILVLAAHARGVPAIERELFAKALRRELGDRALTLETCHRVEAYLASADDAARVAAAIPAGGRTLTAEQAVRHAINVAVGGDSVVVGEDQILHQMRTSLDAARHAGSLDPVVERLFAVALQAGRRARSWHQGPSRSLADVAIASVERQAGPIRDREVLIVGAGRMGRLAVRAAVSAGALVAVANRSLDGAEALADSARVRVESFDPGAPIGAYAVVIVALAGPWPIAAAAIDALADGKTIVVDLSVPVALPVGLTESLGARLITADALAIADEAPAASDGSAARLDSLVDRTTSEFLDWLERRDGRATAEALVEHADRQREAELTALWQRLPGLDPEAREAIDAMTRHLAKRLLREPLERLGRDDDGRDERTVRDLFAL